VLEIHTAGFELCSCVMKMGSDSLLLVNESHYCVENRVLLCRLIIRKDERARVHENVTNVA